MVSGLKARRLLRTLANQTGADCSALLFVHDLKVSIGPAFVREDADAGAQQAAINVAGTAWAAARTRSDLRTGRVLLLKSEALWPLIDDGDVSALVYLSAVPADFPADRHRATLGRITYHARKLVPRDPTYDLVETALETVSLSLREFQLVQIQALLGRFAGNVTAVAKRLGVSRDTIYARCRELGVSPKQFKPSSWPG